MGKSKGSTLTDNIKNALKPGGFDLESFKKSKYLNQSVKYKEQTWIPVSEAVQKATSIPGIAIGHINLIRGHSDTGKTTLLLETAINAQKMGILPVFIVTEMKWSWEHLRQMGFELNEVCDPETGEVIDYEGFFIYIDRGSLNTIEDVAKFILDLLNEQSKGKLPHDLVFLWDSIGSIPCEMSVQQNKNNPMWNAGAMAIQFGNFINQKFPMSRKEGQPYTNTLVAINKIGVAPAETVMAKPKMTNKNGNAMYYDATLVFTFGNVTNSGTSKIIAQKNGKHVEFASRTKIAVSKNHVNGITTKTTVITTVHGFIEDAESAIKKYKKEHSKEWVSILGSEESDIIEDNSEWEETVKGVEITIGDEEILDDQPNE